MPDQSRSAPSFQYLKPTEEQIVLMQKYRDKFEDLYLEIFKEIEGSRGKSVCLTKLEEAAMWINKGITKND